MINFKNTQITAMTIGLVILGSVFLGQASAQQYPSGMPNMSAIPSQVTGTYTNSDYGVQVTIPDGYNGMEMKTSEGVTILTIMPTDMSTGQAPASSMSVMMEKKVPGQTAPTTTDQPQDVKCNQIDASTKTINSVSMNELISECSGSQMTMKEKMDLAQTGSAYVTLMYVATPSSGYDSNLSTYDSLLNSFHLTNAIQSSSETTKTMSSGNAAVPEFPTSIIGVIVAITMGVSLVFGRTKLAKI